MSDSQKMRKIISQKKAIGADKKPKYATRKLNIGLVSCMLGFTLIMTPNSSKADAVETTTVLEDKANPEEIATQEVEENKEEIQTFTAVAKEETPVAEKVEEEKEEEASVEEAKKEEVKEEKTKAETFVEELKTLEVKANEEVDYNKAIANLPQDAKIEVLEKVDTKEAGEKEAKIKVVFDDGSEKEIIVKVSVKKEQVHKAKVQSRAANNAVANEAVPKVEEKLPTNRVQASNWEEKEEKGEDYWGLNQDYGITPTQKIVRVTTSDAIEMNDINYEGSFVDAEGRTNLRMIYMEKSASVSTVWKKAIFRFDEKLYENIDWEKSYGITEKDEIYRFTNSNGKNEKVLDVASMIALRTQNRNNLPINLVLKEGVDLTTLEQRNYLVQMRLVDKNQERIYAFAPGKTPLDYSTYTKMTSVSLEDKIDGTFLDGPKQEQGRKFAFQRQFQSQFIANPDEYDDSTNLGLIRTEYRAERDNLNPGNTMDGKPVGFAQLFDARLVNYLKEDAAGNIAYTNMFNEDRTQVNKVERVGIKRENINYTADGKLAYFVIGESNFEKDGVKVVRVSKLDGTINQSGFYTTALDYVVDKTKLADEFKNSGQDMVDFSVASGWIESNPKGWTIFEKEYDDDYVVPKGQSYIIDTTTIPEGKQIMFQVGDTETSITRTMQGYYAGHKDGSTSFEKIEEIADGVFEFTLREGATIKKGEKIRIYMPDTTDHEGTVSFLEMKNTKKDDGGESSLKLLKDRTINMHLYSKEKNQNYKLIYTLKGKTEQTVKEFKREGLWSFDNEDKVMTGVSNKAVLSTGGNFYIDTTKLEPGTDILIEAYDESGNKIEGKTTSFKFKGLTKSDEKYTNMAWVDSSAVQSLISITKSTFTPYQEIYTNNYRDQYEDFYVDPRFNPESNDKFMTNTTYLDGFSKYDDAKIRMRYIDPNTGMIYIAKVDGDGSEYDDKGNVKKDATKEITVNGIVYKALPYRLDLQTLQLLKENRELGEDGKLTLDKDMRLVLNSSNGSTLPSDWLEVKVKTRILFDSTNGKFEDGTDKSVKVVPENIKFTDEVGYAANGFTGANVKEGTGDSFVTNPTAEGKTFLGWVTAEGKAALGDKTIVKAQDFNKLSADKLFTETTAVTSHQVVYAIWSEEKLVTFDANGGSFAEGKTQLTDDISDGVNAPANPTQEGKEFLGWSKTKDATEADPNYADGLQANDVVYAVWKDSTKQADELTPEYKYKQPLVGDEVSITPTFTKAGTKEVVDAPENAKYKLGEGAPEGVTIDENTGEIKYTVTEADAGKRIDIPVVVEYADGSKDNVEATMDVKQGQTETPVVNPVKVGDKTVSGTAEPNAHIEVKFHDGSKRTTKADAEGNWSVEVPEDTTLAEGTNVETVAVADGKTASEKVETPVQKADQPVVEKTQKPMVEPVKAGDKEITGTTEPGADVEITLPDGTKITGKADDTGKFTVTVPEGKELKENDEIKVVATKEGKDPSDEEVKKVEAADKVYKTKWVQETNGGKLITLKEEDGNKPDDDGKSDIPGYNFVRTEKKEEGNTVTIINVYNILMASKSTGLDGNILANPALGYDKENPDNEDGYTFLFDEASSTPQEVEGKQAYVVNRIYAKNPETVEVVDPNALTEDEQKAVKEAVKAANKDLKDDQISVDGKGNVTITRGPNSGTLDSNLTVKAKDATDMPVVNEPKAGDDKITGTAPKGSEVTVTLPDGTEVTTTADGEGNWSVDVPADKPLAEGDEVKAVAKEEGKTPSDEATATVAKADEDTEAPAAPEVVANEDGSVKVTPPTDEDTDSVMITYTDKDGVEGTVVASKGEDGKWTLPEGTDLTIDEDTGVVTIPEGVAKPGTDVTATAQDKAGNVSEEAKATVAEKDNEKVQTPEIKEVYTDAIDVEGTAEPGSSIIVTFPSGRQTRTGTDQNGKWRASLPDGEVLEEGAEITAVAEKAGKKPSDQASTTVKKLAGEIDVNEPEKTPVDDPTQLTEEEKEKVKEEVKKSNPDLDDENITVNDDGSVDVVDKDGNTGHLDPEQTIVEKEESEVPNIDQPREGDDKITGTAPAGSEVTVTLPDGTEVTTTADEEGNWSVDVPKDKPLAQGDIVRAVAKEEGKKPSEKAIARVLEKEESEKPSINAPKAGDEKITGEGTPGAKVVVKDKDGNVIGETTVNEDGTWEVTPNNPLVEGDKITAEQTEEGKKPSTPAEATVAKKAAGEIDVKEPEKTPVEDPTKLTEEEKEKVKEEVKKSNPDLDDENITVNDDGSVDVVDKDGNTGHLTPEQTIVEKEESEKPSINAPKAGDEKITGEGTPGAKVVVKDKDGNVIGETTVNEDGTWEVTPNNPLVEGDKITAEQTEEGKKPSTPAEATVAKADEATETPTLNPVKAGDKEITGKAEAGSDVEITLPDGTKVTGKADEEGNFKVELPEGKELKEGEEVKAVATKEGKKPSDEVTEKVGKKDAGEIDVKEPEKTPVEDPKHLTDEEKEKVKEEVKKSNPDLKDEDIKVNDDGSVDITDKDGKKGHLDPEQTIREKKDNEKVEVKIPEEKTLVDDKNNLTDKEKEEVKKKLEDANKDNFPEGTKVVIGNDGTATITYPDGSETVIPGSELVEEKTPAGKTDKTDAENNPAVIPSEKTQVKDKNNLTDDEKAEIIKKIKEANPSVVDVKVDNKGNATLIYKDGSKNFIKAEDLVVEKTKGNGTTPGKANRINKDYSKKSNNVKTGVASASGLVATIAAAVGGLFATKKRKNKED